MLVSVVTPVYNAEPFLRKAVESALAQPETGEVLLVEDGSADNSLKECKRLDDEFAKVRLLTHPANANLGAGPSRNLGIHSARFDHVAFLDADDYYLPNRFRAEREIFAQYPDADGVYGALGFHFYSEDGRRRFRDPAASHLTSVTDRVSPEDLFERLIGLDGYFGGISPDTLTVSKRTALRVGGFPALELHEDTDFILRLTLLGRLYPGIIDEPVGMRGVHDSNRIVRNHDRSGSEIRMYRSLMEWAETNRIDSERLRMIQAKLDLAKLRSSPFFMRPAKLAVALAKNVSFLRWRNYRNESVQALLPDPLLSKVRRLLKRR